MSLLTAGCERCNCSPALVKLPNFMAALNASSWRTFIAIGYLREEYLNLHCDDDLFVMGLLHKQSEWERKMNKKKLYSTLMLSTGMVVATAGFASAETELTVATYGGEWGAAMQDCIITPFAAQAGVTVTPEPGVSAVTLSKLEQQKSNPVIDVAWMDGGVSELAAAAGVLEGLKTDRVSNISGMLDQGIYRNEDGDIFAVSTGYYSLGLAYNTDDLDEKPQSWYDLWRPEYAGAVTFPSPSNAMGVPFIVHVAELEGGGVEDVQKGLNRLSEMDVAAYFDTAGSATNLFQSGEAMIGAHYASSVFSMKEQGLPVEFVVPEEGAIGGDIRLHLVAGTPRKEVAEDFINFAIGKEPASCMVERLFVGPATKGLALDDDTKAKLPWGAEGSIDNLVLPDWDSINVKRAQIIERFNKSLAN